MWMFVEQNKNMQGTYSKSKYVLVHEPDPQILAIGTILSE